jgi:response regulator RpfG family c-di-GMP phosphodiesterase
VGVRYGKRTYQRFSGLERQRGAAKQARVAGTDRLKDAERQLVEAQRELVTHGDLATSQEIERLRKQLSTMADRLRYATYGYSPVGSADPIKEAELAELQERDADMITEAAAIYDLTEKVNSSTRAGESTDLEPLRAGLEHLRGLLDRRRTVN